MNDSPARSDDALLDAARDCVLTVGLRRTTLTDVARRAGVSRTTMYRRWPDMRALIAELMTREWSALALAAADYSVGDTAREQVVDSLVRGVGELRVNPMFRRIVELDPEILLPYLVARRGASQSQFIDQFTEYITEAQATRSVRAGDPKLLARTIILTAQAFVISAVTMADEVTLDQLDGQLRLLLDRYLAP